MRISKAITLFAATALLMTGRAFAADVWLSPVQIYSLYVNESGLTIYLANVNVSYSTCGGNQFFIPMTNLNYKTDVAGVFMAFSLAKNLQLHLVDATPTCQPVVDRFNVPQ